jgi:hypothetical protein
MDPASIGIDRMSDGGLRVLLADMKAELARR